MGGGIILELSLLRVARMSDASLVSNLLFSFMFELGTVVCILVMQRPGVMLKLFK